MTWHHYQRLGKIMPIYQCYSPKGLLTKSVKAKIAEEITSIHSSATAAPELFVNVLFQDTSDGDCFVAGQPSTHSYIFGAIRHGRDLETRQGMLRELSPDVDTSHRPVGGRTSRQADRRQPSKRHGGRTDLPEAGPGTADGLSRTAARLTELGFLPT